jgi:hypothetical protein
MVRHTRSERAARVFVQAVNERLQIRLHSRITTNGSASRHGEREDLLLGCQQSAELVDQTACGRVVYLRDAQPREKSATEETSH